MDTAQTNLGQTGPLVGKSAGKLGPALIDQLSKPGSLNDHRFPSFRFWKHPLPGCPQLAPTAVLDLHNCNVRIAQKPFQVPSDKDAASARLVADNVGTAVAPNKSQSFRRSDAEIHGVFRTMRICRKSAGDGSSRPNNSLTFPWKALRYVSHLRSMSRARAENVREIRSLFEHDVRAC